MSSVSSVYHDICEPGLAAHNSKSSRRSRSKPLRPMENKELREELLPGIPNDTTLDTIIPKSRWQTLQVMSSVGSKQLKVVGLMMLEFTHTHPKNFVCFETFLALNKKDGRLHIRSKKDEQQSHLYMPPKITQLGGL